MYVVSTLKDPETQSKEKLDLFFQKMKGMRKYTDRELDETRRAEIEQKCKSIEREEMLTHGQRVIGIVGKCPILKRIEAIKTVEGKGRSGAHARRSEPIAFGSMLPVNEVSKVEVKSRAPQGINDRSGTGH